MQTSDLALAVQTLSLIFQVGAFTVIFKQLTASQRTLNLNTLIQRRELYVSLTHSLSADNINTLMLHAFDHFDMDTFRRDYQHDMTRVRSYLLMKRKYFYLLVASGIQSDARDPLHGSPTEWLKELCRYREFQDVHRRHRHYYPSFTQIVDPLVAAVPDPVWAQGEDLYPVVERGPGTPAAASSVPS